MKNILILITLIYASSISAQNTKSWEDRTESIEISFPEKFWMPGRWIGIEGTQAEIAATDTKGKTLSFVLKLLKGDTITGFQVGQIIEKNNTVHLKLKTFDKYFEEQSTDILKLVDVYDGTLYFDGYTIAGVRREGVGEIYLHIYHNKEIDGTMTELKYVFKKKKTIVRTKQF